MVSEDQQTHAQRTLDQLPPADIIRDIIRIEQAWIAANGPMSDRLMDEILEALRAVVTVPWMVGQANGSVTIQHTSWRSSANITHNDAWLELVEIAADDNDHSWLAAISGSGATRTGFELRFRPGLPHRGMTPAESKKAVELGFEVLNGGEAIFLPLTIDREALAKAFETDTFAEALAPVGIAIAQVIAAQSELDRLIGLVRKRGKTG